MIRISLFTRSRRAVRRGISLMEVLISIFVLAVGLLGVAAMIPAGRHEIVEGTKLETAAMVGRGAFRDIQTRGYMNPVAWYDSTNAADAYTATNFPTPFTVRTNATTNGPSNQVAYAIDPLGLMTPAGSYLANFPSGAGSVPPPLLRILPFQPSTNAYACFDTIFRSSVDLTTTANTTNKDLPPVQQYFGTNQRRVSEGNYSWLATIVSDPSKSALDSEVTVSVAVFYKRTLAQAAGGVVMGEYVVLPGNVAFSGIGEITLNNLPNFPGTTKPVFMKPGQWLMLAGQDSDASANLRNHYTWYRVLSARSAVGSSQQISVAGPTWIVPAANTTAWLFDNIVAVYEKNLPLELP